jgi:hypothetical protein
LRYFNLNIKALATKKGGAPRRRKPSYSFSEGAAVVDYHTADTDTFAVGCADRVNNQGGAYARCDFAITVGSLSFAPCEVSKTLTVPIINDGHAEAAETFQLRLSNPPGATLRGDRCRHRHHSG